MTYWYEKDPVVRMFTELNGTAAGRELESLDMSIFEEDEE